MNMHRTFARGTLLFVGVLVLSILPNVAHAGTGVSTHCSDGITGPNGSSTEIHIVNNPVTFNVEVAPSQTGLLICYSTTPYGSTAPAVTGGYIGVHPAGPSPVWCTQDTSPVVLGIDCVLRDDEPTSPGRTLEVTIRFQTWTYRLVAGVELSPPAVVACLDDAVFFTPTGNVGPVDIGVCA
jgi:hypothetical protein